MSDEQNQNRTGSKLFDFSKATFEVEVDVTSNPDKPVIVTHRLNKPTTDMLIIRDGKTKFEIVEVSATEQEEKVDDKKGNLYLYEQLDPHVAGYRVNRADTTPLTEFRRVDGALKDLLDKQFPEHKHAAVRGMYLAEAFLIEDEHDDDDDLGGFIMETPDDNIKVRLHIGPEGDDGFDLVFTFRTPSEDERTKYINNASKLLSRRGSRKSHNTVHTKLRESIKFFDQMIEDIDGGSVNGQMFAQSDRETFLAQVDAIYKRITINKALERFTAKVRD